MSKKDKAQVHSGYRSAVFAADTSGCSPLAGNLKKKNSHGVWQTRYFYLNNDFLIYKKDSRSTDIKGVVDVGDISSLSSTPKGDLTVVMNGGEELNLKGNDGRDASRWVAAIQERMDWVQREKELTEEGMASLAKSTDSTENSIKLSGWLMKKSPHKYGGMQERFVRLENNHLMYFKKEDDPNSASLGTINLESADWVRPYDSSNVGRIFEVHSQQRVFVFEAESRSQMLEWIKAIEDSIKSAKELLQMEAKAKEVASLPFRIRLYDEKGPDTLVTYVMEDLEEIYPIPTPKDGEERVTTEDHLSLAGQVWDYIEDILPEVAKVTGAHPRPARLDVLATSLLTINRFLTNRLSPILTPDIMDTTVLSLGDIHMMVDWLCKYQIILRDIYCPPLTPDSPSPTAFPLFDYIPELCSIYAKGSLGLDGASKHLKEHATKIWQNFISKPAEFLETHKDGSFFTHCPIDIWELLHYHMSLASSTGSPVMTFMIAESIAETINTIITQVTSYVEKMHQPDPEAIFREVELELLCALANDLALHSDQLEDVVDKFELNEIKRKVDDLFQSVKGSLFICGQTCLRRLSALIMEDINDHLQEIFTPAWLGNPPPTQPPTAPSSQISIVIATVSDYMTDLTTFLSSSWAKQTVTCILEALVTRYFKSVMKIQTTAPPQTKTKERRLFVSSKDIKGMVDKIVVAGLRANDITVGLIQQDTDAIVKFFREKSDSTDQYCQVLYDLNKMLSEDPDKLSSLLMARINQCPPAAQAIIETANRCAALRDDLEKDEMDAVFLPLEPMLEVHNQLGGDSEITSVSEEYQALCGLYCNLGLTQKKSTLSSKLLNMASLSLRGRSQMDIESPMNSPIKKSPANAFQHSDLGRISNVEEVINVLKSDEEEYQQLIKEEEEEMKKRLEEEELALEAGKAALNLEGYMEKKSPAHNLWQERYFKLMTRVSEKEGGGFNYTHTLLWFKKKRGSALKAVDAKSICGMQLLSSPRSLAYLTDDFNVHLAHDPEGMRGVPVKEWDVENTAEPNSTARLTQSHGQHFSFMLQVEGLGGGSSGEKDVILRVGSVDVLIKWMNFLAAAAQLEYDPGSGIWNKGERKKKVNPKSIMKFSSMPDETHKKAVYNRSVSAVATSHSTLSNVATAGSNHIHTITSQDSFEEQLREEDEEGSDVEGGEADEGEGFSRLPGGKTSLYLEGQMDKKSPAHNMWQERWFKLMTRVTDGDVVYSFSWYKKRGAKALKTVTADSISGLTLLSSPKGILYVPNDFTVHNTDTSGHLQGIPVKEENGDTSSKREYSFSVSLLATSAGGDKDIILRVDNIEKLVNWINLLTEAASLVYDNLQGCWVKGERVKVQQSNPKSYILRASTTPFDEGHEKDKHGYHRSASAIPTSSSLNTAHGSNLTTLSTESDDFDERQHSNDSTESFPPPPTPPASSRSSKASPPQTYSPKQILQKKVIESSSTTTSSTKIETSRPFSNSPNSIPPSAPAEVPSSSPNNHPDPNESSESYNPITISTIDIPALASSKEEGDEGYDSRPSDLYSLHSDGIPEHDEEEENRNDEELLTGDGSKPVGCTSCVVQ